TLRRLPDIQAIYQLHRNLGVSAAENTEAALIANADAKCQGEGISLTVAPDGKSYTVKVGSRGKARTFKTRHAAAKPGGRPAYMMTVGPALRGPRARPPLERRMSSSEVPPVAGATGLAPAEKVKSFPTTPGVYLMKDEAGTVIYVGKAKNLRNR